MTENKATVSRYIDGFRQGDHALVLSCLTDDVVWDIPGMFHVTGKAAFDKEIENDAFVGKPAITLSRMTEENDVVRGGGCRARSAERGRCAQRGVLRCLRYARGKDPAGHFVPARGEVIARAAD
jgi:ketosteroid isomerase-like protein